MSMNPFQRSRRRNIDLMRTWLKNGTPEEEIIQKACAVIGCTKTKAKEYLEVIVGS